MQNGSGAGAPGCSERPPPKQRVDVMSMDDVGAKLSYRVLDRIGIGTAQNQRLSCS
jgi:hypothetical protein